MTQSPPPNPDRGSEPLERLSDAAGAGPGIVKGFDPERSRGGLEDLSQDPAVDPTLGSPDEGREVAQGNLVHRYVDQIPPPTRSDDPDPDHDSAVPGDHVYRPVGDIMGDTGNDDSGFDLDSSSDPLDNLAWDTWDPSVDDPRIQPGPAILNDDNDRSTDGADQAPANVNLGRDAKLWWPPEPDTTWRPTPGRENMSTLIKEKMRPKVEWLYGSTALGGLLAWEQMRSKKGMTAVTAVKLGQVATLPVKLYLSQKGAVPFFDFLPFTDIIGDDNPGTLNHVAPADDSDTPVDNAPGAQAGGAATPTTGQSGGEGSYQPGRSLEDQPTEGTEGGGTESYRPGTSIVDQGGATEGSTDDPAEDPSTGRGGSAGARGSEEDLDTPGREGDGDETALLGEVDGSDGNVLTVEKGEGIQDAIESWLEAHSDGYSELSQSEQDDLAQRAYQHFEITYPDIFETWHEDGTTYAGNSDIGWGVNIEDGEDTVDIPLDADGDMMADLEYFAEDTERIPTEEEIAEWKAGRGNGDPGDSFGDPEGPTEPEPQPPQEHIDIPPEEELDHNNSLDATQTNGVVETIRANFGIGNANELWFDKIVPEYGAYLDQLVAQGALDKVDGDYRIPAHGRLFLGEDIMNVIREAAGEQAGADTIELSTDDRQLIAQGNRMPANGTQEDFVRILNLEIPRQFDFDQFWNNNKDFYFGDNGKVIGAWRFFREDFLNNVSDMIERTHDHDES